MANPTKDQLTINALRERVELIEKEISNKNFIIKDQKSVILDYKSIVLDKEIDIECLKIDNKELNKQLSYKDNLFNFIVYPILIVSVFSLVITLWK